MTDDTMTARVHNSPIQRVCAALSRASRRVQNWRCERWWKVPTVTNGAKWRNLSGEAVLVWSHEVYDRPTGIWTCEISGHYGHVYGTDSSDMSTTALDAALAAAYLWMDRRIPQQADFEGRPIVPIRDGRPVRDFSAETHLYLDDRDDVDEIVELVGKQEEIARLKGESA